MYANKHTHGRTCIRMDGWKQVLVRQSRQRQGGGAGREGMLAVSELASALQQAPFHLELEQAHVQHLWRMISKSRPALHAPPHIDHAPATTAQTQRPGGTVEEQTREQVEVGHAGEEEGVTAKEGWDNEYLPAQVVSRSRVGYILGCDSLYSRQ